MQHITAVSQITAADVADYIRLTEPDYQEINTINSLLAAAKAFIESYTGRTEEELDNYPDFVIAVLILVQDMYDNRTMYVDSTNLNFAVSSILDLHSVNLL